MNIAKASCMLNAVQHSFLKQNTIITVKKITE